jgi:hypothetical protein
MRRLLTLAPKNVLISAAIAIFALLMFAALIPVLGGARDAAITRGEQLTSSVAGAQSKLAGLGVDHQYVLDHREEYETLLASDKLVPHTRRAALVTLQETATVHGITGLTWTFTAASATSRAAVESQSLAGGYTVAVETIELTVDAPLDGPIYRFVSDIMQTFPGSLTLNAFTLSRAPEITGAALAAVSAGAPSQIVKGEISLSWRIAQADKTSSEKAK